MSYLNAAELLLKGDESQPGFQRNKLFAFINYLGAYTNGAFFCRDQMIELSKEIESEMGIRLPKIVYVDESIFEESKQGYSKGSEHLDKKEVK